MAPTKWHRVCLLVLLALMLFGMFGCGAAKYRVDYCGSKDMYSNARDSYRAGSQVKLIYTFVATDTDYRFYLDGQPVNYTYENDAFVITFTMPEHDVTLDYTMENSMMPTE